jgi:hypothetical protein
MNFDKVSRFRFNVPLWFKAYLLHYKATLKKLGDTYEVIPVLHMKKRVRHESYDLDETWLTDKDELLTDWFYFHKV